MAFLIEASPLWYAFCNPIVSMLASLLKALVWMILECPRKVYIYIYLDAYQINAFRVGSWVQGASRLRILTNLLFMHVECHHHWISLNQALILYSFPEPAFWIVYFALTRSYAELINFMIELLVWSDLDLFPLSSAIQAKTIALMAILNRIC